MAKEIVPDDSGVHSTRHRGALGQRTCALARISVHIDHRPAAENGRPLARKPLVFGPDMSVQRRCSCRELHSPDFGIPRAQQAVKGRIWESQSKENVIK